MLRNKKFKVSVCVTTFNESEETIQRLLDALSKQTLKPDEIIMVDASASPIFNSQFSIYNQFSNLNLQIINKLNTSRAEGRNIAIKKARNEIIAITDSGCIPQNDWLEEITKPFGPTSPRLRGTIHVVVAGGYEMIVKQSLPLRGRNNFEKAESVFLGVNTKNMGKDFMPSARSMAFTKTIWKKAGGFPEDLNDTAEDTVFNLNLLNAGAKFVTAKNAIVDWEMPDSIKKFYLKIKNYAKGDAVSGIWWHPVKKWRTHNIKVASIIMRYLIFIIAFYIYQPFFWLLAIIYLLFAYRKAKYWGIILQLTSDFAAMQGFLSGINR